MKKRINTRNYSRHIATSHLVFIKITQPINCTNRKGPYSSKLFEYTSKALLYLAIVSSVIFVVDFVSYFLLLQRDIHGGFYYTTSLLSLFDSTISIKILVPIFGLFFVYEQLINLSEKLKKMIARVLLIVCALLVLFFNSKANAAESSSFSVKPYQLFQEGYKFNLESTINIDRDINCDEFDIKEVQLFFGKTFIYDLGEFERAKLISGKIPQTSEQHLNKKYSDALKYLSALEQCLSTVEFSGNAQNVFKLFYATCNLVTLNAYWEFQNEITKVTEFRLSREKYKTRLTKIDSLLDNINLPIDQKVDSVFWGAKYNIEGIMNSLTVFRPDTIPIESFSDKIDKFFKELTIDPQRKLALYKIKSDSLNAIIGYLGSLKKLDDPTTIQRQIQMYPIASIYYQNNKLDSLDIKSNITRMDSLLKHEVKQNNLIREKINYSYVEFRTHAGNYMAELLGSIYRNQSADFSLLTKLNSKADTLGFYSYPVDQINTKIEILKSILDEHQRMYEIKQKHFEYCKEFFVKSYKYYKGMSYIDPNSFYNYHLRFIPVKNYMALGTNLDMIESEDQLLSILGDKDELQKFDSSFAEEKRQIYERAKVKKEIELLKLIQNIENSKLYFEYGSNHVMVPESNLTFNRLIGKINKLDQILIDKDLTDSVKIRITGHNGITKSGLLEKNIFEKTPEYYELAFARLAIHRAIETKKRFSKINMGHLFICDKVENNSLDLQAIDRVELFTTIESSVEFEVLNKQLLFSSLSISE